MRAPDSSTANLVPLFFALTSLNSIFVSVLQNELNYAQPLLQEPIVKKSLNYAQPLLQEPIAETKSLNYAQPLLQEPTAINK